MGQSLSFHLIHLVFSTKDRREYITPDIEPRLHGYMHATIDKLGSRCLAINGTADHVHILIDLSRDMALSELVRRVKGSSSTWIRSKGVRWRAFHWQDGYGAFSVGRSGAQAVERYIARQKEHHRRRTFQEELVTILEAHRIEFDPMYLWT